MGDAGEVGGEECQRARVYGARCREGGSGVVSGWWLFGPRGQTAAVNGHVRICGVTTDWQLTPVSELGGLRVYDVIKH